MPWKYVPKVPQWKGWEIERQQKTLKEFLEDDEDGEAKEKKVKLAYDGVKLK